MRLEKERVKDVAKKEKERAREEAREKRATEKIKVRKGNEAQMTNDSDPTTLTMAQSQMTFQNKGKGLTEYVNGQTQNVYITLFSHTPC